MALILLLKLIVIGPLYHPASNIRHLEIVSNYITPTSFIAKTTKNALHEVVESGHMEAAKVLMIAGANILDADDYGNTPLSLADYDEIKELILSFREDIKEPEFL